MASNPGGAPIGILCRAVVPIGGLPERIPFEYKASFVGESVIRIDIIAGSLKCACP